jgi:hypothetical protein
MRFEEMNDSEAQLMPTVETLRSQDFLEFSRWWYQIRMNCGPSANVSKHRAIALLIPSLQNAFGINPPSASQWTLIGRFLKNTRETARTVLNIEFPEPKGKWNSQRRQLDAYDEVCKVILAK